MIKETYYAIRIGNPRKNITYLAINHDNINYVPDLFSTKIAAQQALLKIDCNCAKIIKVKIEQIRER